MSQIYECCLKYVDVISHVWILAQVGGCCLKSTDTTVDEPQLNP